MKSWGLDNIFFLLELKLAVWLFSALAVTPTKSKEESQRPLPPGAEVSWGWKLGRGFPLNRGDMNTIRIQVNPGRESGSQVFDNHERPSSRHVPTTEWTHQPPKDMVIMPMHLKKRMQKKRKANSCRVRNDNTACIYRYFEFKAVPFPTTRNGAMRAESTACE